jgi:hypothetical protein
VGDRPCPLDRACFPVGRKTKGAKAQLFLIRRGFAQPPRRARSVYTLCTHCTTYSRVISRRTMAALTSGNAHFSQSLDRICPLRGTKVRPKTTEGGHFSLFRAIREDNFGQRFSRGSAVSEQKLIGYIYFTGIYVQRKMSTLLKKTNAPTLCAKIHFISRFQTCLMRLIKHIYCTEHASNKHRTCTCIELYEENYLARAHLIRTRQLIEYASFLHNGFSTWPTSCEWNSSFSFASVSR